jgi:ribosomal protein S18 acetylase RimI-like enzyme
VTIEAMRYTDVEEICRLHCALLPGGVLVRLGPAVLYQIYLGALKAPGVIGLVARDGRDVGGFLVATANTRVLFCHILLRRALPLGTRLLQVACRHPDLVARMVESLRYPKTLDHAAAGPGRSGELMAIGIRAESRSQGYGKALVDTLNQEFRRLGVAVYTVATYASNKSARAFYEKLGFEVAHEFRMYGARWVRYQRRLEPR